MTPLRHILHADDEPDIREIVRLSLEMLGGFELTQCASGIEAIEQASNAAPDMIILDVMMPGLDGEETFLRLREIEALSDTPILFMTARVSNSDFETLRALGAAEVLIKPFDPISLPEQLNEIWARLQGGQ
jgi:CheY-like chemotaxis protein